MQIFTNKIVPKALHPQALQILKQFLQILKVRSLVCLGSLMYFG